MNPSITYTPLRCALFALCAWSVTGCERQEPATTPPAKEVANAGVTDSNARAPKKKVEATPSVLKAPVPYKLDGIARVVAIGDVHGDFQALRDALFAAKLIDSEGRWIGQDAVLVQTGDLLDRGDDEQQIIDYLDQLGKEARAQKGNILELVGNHETMNVKGDIRYVTPGGYEDFEDIKGLDLSHPATANLPEHARARRAAFVPGGPYALRLAEHHTIGVVNDSVFAHGGVLPSHVDYGLGRLNDEVRAWMAGAGTLPSLMSGPDAPTWTRAYSAPQPGENPCPQLEQVLNTLDAKRMVLGHTVQQQGITQRCDGKLWLIDVGMSKHYGGKAAALEILADGSTTIMTRKD